MRAPSQDRGGYAYGRVFMWSLNSQVTVLSSTAIEFGDGDAKEIIKMKRGHQDGA